MAPDGWRDLYTNTLAQVRSEFDRAYPLVIGGRRIRDGERKASTSPSNSFLPSIEPSCGSVAFSGCGIMPSTFLVLLKIPAMLRAEPLGLLVASTVPSGPQ